MAAGVGFVTRLPRAGVAGAAALRVGLVGASYACARAGNHEAASISSTWARVARTTLKSIPTGIIAGVDGACAAF